MLIFQDCCNMKCVQYVTSQLVVAGGKCFLRAYSCGVFFSLLLGIVRTGNARVVKMEVVSVTFLQPSPK